MGRIGLFTIKSSRSLRQGIIFINLKYFVITVVGIGDLKAAPPHSLIQADITK
jgi:hypothetical protein